MHVSVTLEISEPFETTVRKVFDDKKMGFRSDMGLAVMMFPARHCKNTLIDLTNTCTHIALDIA